MRWLMAAAAAVPILMFAALAWYGYGRTMDQARHALLQTSRVVHEHAAKVLEVSPALSQEYFAGFYRDVAKPYPGLTIALLRSNGEIVARYPDDPDTVRSYERTGPMMKAIRAGATHGIVDGPSTREKTYRLAAFRQVEPLPLYVVVSRTSRLVLEEWRHDVTTLAYFVMPTSLALMLAVWITFTRARSEHAATLKLREEATRHLQTEDQLRQFQKYEALGELTGGIAHDFNNLLHIVSTNAAVLSLLTKDRADLKPHLAAITRAVANGTMLTQNLLAFARKRPLTFTRVSLSETLPAICELARHSLPKTIELKCGIDGRVRDILADVAELELAIINLIVNARDAMAGGGIIEVSAQDVPPHSVDPGVVPDSAGTYVAISVSDTGTGIPSDVLDRMFEPFFTTKKEKGTGLGLSRVYGYVRQLGGSVAAKNRAAGGAVVTLYIPGAEPTACDPEELEIRIAALSPPAPAAQR
jgi:two-component system NtrC family sensor kinase